MRWEAGHVSRRQRWSALGRSGATLWLTGPPAAGTSTLAAAVERRLIQRRRSAYRLDAADVDRTLAADLPDDRAAVRERSRRLAELARLFADAGTVAVVAADSPYALDRQHARVLHAADGLLFIEVFVNTPLSIRVERDRSGRYRDVIDRALSGVRGLEQPFEPPHSAEVEITPELQLSTAVDQIVAALAR